MGELIIVSQRRCGALGLHSALKHLKSHVWLSCKFDQMK